MMIKKKYQNSHLFGYHTTTEIICKYNKNRKDYYLFIYFVICLPINTMKFKLRIMPTNIILYNLTKHSVSVHDITHTN